jgi:SAUR family protein
MKKIRGFKIGKRLVRVTRWILHKTRPVNPQYELLTPQTTPQKPKKPISKLINWGRRFFTRGANNKSLSAEPEPVRKGYTAVYVVGREDGAEFQRVMVPVIYLNHPLFCELLREAEEEYGFHQQGGITIPCRFSEFEKIQARIAAGAKKLTWKSHH